jgi:hypothetical protein
LKIVKPGDYEVTKQERKSYHLEKGNRSWARRDARTEKHPATAAAGNPSPCPVPHFLTTNGLTPP